MSVEGMIVWGIVDQDCDLCDSVRREGWWGMSGITHCRACHRTWKMTTKQAHCTVCCAHFSSPSAFDMHLGPYNEAVACLDPARVTNKKTGEILLVQREDGTWTRPQKEGWYPDADNGHDEMNH